MNNLKIILPTFDQDKKDAILVDLGFVISLRYNLIIANNFWSF